ncbi:hypothetical protein HS7_20520 [Sulfolobales archaeon HS-7]|nr:hypothetical protein HS7_20520 [Sulfolobales archaeon HS-7]
MSNYIVNNEGFLVDPNTGEIVDEFSYRIDYTNFYNTTLYETLAIKRIERTVTQIPKINVKRYLVSLLPSRLKEEFLSGASKISDKAEVFAHFIGLCREYGIIFDFDKLRESLDISKISLRRARKEIMMKNKQRPWERVDKIFFEISDEIERKYWLASVLVVIEYQRRGIEINIDEIKRHLEVEVKTKSSYLTYLLRNGKNSILEPYPCFKYMLCPHAALSKIKFSKKKFVVMHLGKEENCCFVVSAKKVERILSKMEVHYEAMKNKENTVQLPQVNQ